VRALKLIWIGLPFVLLASPHASACDVPASVRASADQLNANGDRIPASIMIGLAEADIPQCVAEAIQTFGHIKEMGDETASQFADGMLLYLKAVQQATSGNRTAAVMQLRTVIEKYDAAPIYLRAVSQMTALLLPFPRDPQWDFLTQQLGHMTTIENFDGTAVNAIGVLCVHQIQTGDPAGALTRFESYLGRPLPMQPRLQALTVYLELLRAAGRDADARLLTMSLDGEVGTRMLDYGWRLRYLAACAAAWSLAKDTQGQERFDIYSRALLEAKSEAQ
jgi:hypothetical protein